MVFFFSAFLFAEEDVALGSFQKGNEHLATFDKNPLLKGIVLEGKEKDFKYGKVGEIQSYNLKLSRKEKHLKELLTPYLFSSNITKETITSIKREIIQFYQKNGRPVIYVYTPPQDISSGILQLVIIEGKIGSITVEGNKWFSDKTILSHMKQKPGDVIKSDILSENLYVINRNPFRNVEAVYTPGKKKKTTDIKLLTSDRIPFRIYTGADNTGNDVTDRYRLFIGMNESNLLCIDEVISYQFICSTHYDKFSAHTGYFTFPLPPGHIFTLYGGYSPVDSRFEIEGSPRVFRVHGYSAQASFRYDIPFTANGQLIHELMFGMDYKRTNNNLDYGTLPIQGRYVNLTQLMLGYNLGYKTQQTTTSLEIEGFLSPLRWLPGQSKEDFRSLRILAKNKYAYFRSSFSFLLEIYKKVHIDTYLRAQVATCNLLPSEQYGLGGYDTVRGYKERIVNVDNAFILNIELKTPSFGPLAYMFSKKIDDRLEFLGFFDWGWGCKHKTVSVEHKYRSLLSVGPGFRYSISPNIMARGDFGFRLKYLERVGLSMPNSRFHFSVILGF